jgi:hypothetical protein
MRIKLAIASFVSLFLTACSATPPEVDGVQPATVCGGGSQITITGKDFQKDSKVELDCGAAAPLLATTVTANSDMTQLVATFGAGDAPNGATCDVVVKNGDASDPKPHKTVTIVSGPVVFFVDPPVVYNGINTRVTLYATALQQPLPPDAVSIVPAGQSSPVTVLQTNTVPDHANRLQAVVPTGQAPGAYDLLVKDSSGCGTQLANALTVTGTLTVTLKSVTPPFGATNSDTAVTILRDTSAASPANAPFVDTPHVFLNPTAAAPTDIAVSLQSVTFLDQDRVTGVVPANTPVHDYDVVLVNPDGTVGVLQKGFNVTASPPPVIDSATPSSIVAATGQNVLLAGHDFDSADTVSLSCIDAASNPVAAPAVTAQAPSCTNGACTQAIVINGSSLSAGSVCVVRVTNADGSYGDYSAIGVTTPALNLSAPHAGPNMNVGRRALVSAAGNATSANRFVYAIGGDDGTTAGALASVELAPVDVFGKIGAFTVDPVALPGKRTLAGSVTVGRYIYVAGGDDGTGPIQSAARALILSPREAPSISDIDVGLVQQGLDAGTYRYRVSATFAQTDTDNPGGESLASDSFTVKLPVFPANKMTIALTWKAPVDSLGAPLPNVSGYKIYRTAKDGAPGSEVLYATVASASTLTFTDDGSGTLGTQAPLPLGSTGAWAALPDMGTKRSGLALAWANDPSTPGTFYVYAIYGESAAKVATTTYELLPITVASNGRQTAASAWTPGTSQSVGSGGRWQMRAWVANAGVSSYYSSATWIFVGGGLDGNNASDGTVEAAQVTPGGQLSAFNGTPKDFSTTIAGYGVCAANGQLFTFGGQNAAPSSGATSATLTSTPPGVAVNSWNSEGLTMTHPRYLLGSAVQSAFIFLLGGKTDTDAASTTTELVIW